MLVDPIAERPEHSLVDSRDTFIVTPSRSKYLSYARETMLPQGQTTLNVVVSVKDRFSLVLITNSKKARVLSVSERCALEIMPSAPQLACGESTIMRSICSVFIG